MRLLFIILMIPLRLIAAIGIAIGTITASSVYAITYAIKYRSFSPVRRAGSVIIEMLRDACVFPFWPIIQYFRN